LEILVDKDRVILKGKAWEIRRKLKEYSLRFDTVHDWIKAMHSESR